MKLLCPEVKRYCAGKVARPFFYAVGSREYPTVLHELSELCPEIIRTSNFCRDKDLFPDIDGLVSTLESFTDKIGVVIGLGEFLALKGHEFTAKNLSRIKDIPARCVLLLRCVTSAVRDMAGDDFRINAQGRVFVGKDEGNVITVIRSGNSGNNGVKSLIESLENGKCGEILTDTALDISGSTLRVCDSPYDALTELYRAVDVPREIGRPEQWSRLLREYINHGRDIQSVITSHNIDGSRFPDDDYERWLCFMALRQNPDGSYLSYSAENSPTFSTFTDSIITSITKIPSDSPNYPQYYYQRKEILKSFPDGEISRIIPRLNISSLTDTTIHEREAIIDHVSQHGLTDEIRDIYPALWGYCGDYDLGQEWMNEYFSRYRLQKLMNNPDTGFEAMTAKFAECETQKAETRDNVIRSHNDGRTFLIWVDALGVEFVPLMKYLAGLHGLRLTITVTRANIPTITAMNREFFDTWPDNLRYKDSRLDSIKHEESGKLSASYIASEIDAVSEAFTRAKTSLSHGDFSRVIITGDHGASRLAVLSCHKEKYECGGKAEHSGRCCTFFAGCSVTHSITENGYTSLTDYGSFSGGRISGRELHGGATPEEILTPVCILEGAKSRGKPATVRREFDEAFAV